MILIKLQNRKSSYDDNRQLSWSKIQNK
jgi:hypothetical protein